MKKSASKINKPRPKQAKADHTLVQISLLSGAGCGA